MLESRRLLRPRVSLMPALLLGIAVLGCEDPSNVGLGLIGESGGDPVRVQVPASARPYSYTAPPTLNVRTSLGYATGAVRVLAGTVDDPLFGSISTKGYIDFAPSTSQGTEYRSGTITSVRLVLFPDYVYGDSAASTSVIVSEMQEAWPSTSMTADTTLSPGVEITRVDFTYADDDSLVVDLPEAWYSARSSVLRSANIVDDFHGFELSTSDPSAVVGFEGVSGILRIVTTTGTAEMVVSKLFTHVERTAVVDTPPGTVAVQDGIGQNPAMFFDFSADSIEGAAVSRAVIEFAVDSAAMADTPPNFVRPAPTQFDFLGVTADGTVRLLRSAIRSGNKIRFVSTSAAAGEVTIIRLIQQAAAGSTEYTEFRIRIAETQAAINSILLFSPDAAEGAPKALLTMTPNSF